MDIGVIIFPTDKAIQPIQLAKEVESRGFESLWFPEHSHIPSSRETPWGGRAGAPPLPFVSQGKKAAFGQAVRQRSQLRQSRRASACSSCRGGRPRPSAP